jgi:hypothetical protein
MAAENKCQYITIHKRHVLISIPEYNSFLKPSFHTNAVDFSPINSQLSMYVHTSFLGLRRNEPPVSELCIFIRLLICL